MTAVLARRGEVSGRVGVDAEERGVGAGVKGRREGSSQL